MNFEFQVTLPHSSNSGFSDGAPLVSLKKDGSVRVRNWHPKSRYGCLTCKKRRVKCDETRPNCLRCQSLKKECKYDDTKEWLFEPRDPAISRSIIRANESPQESRALQIYQNVLTAVLGNFNTAADHFWKCLVPQTSEHNEAIKHQLVATAFMEDPHLSDAMSMEEAEKKAGRYYGKALTLLTRQEMSPDPHIMLMSCLLSMAYETIRGDSAVTFLHFQSGLQVLREWKHDQQNKRQSEADDLITLYIEPIFAQLEAAAAMLGVTGRVPITPVEELSFTRPVMPKNFVNMLMAREKFFELGSWLYYCYRLDPASSSEGSVVFKDQMDLWKEWYEVYIRSKDKWPLTTTRQQLQLKLLETHYHNHIITLICHAQPGEVIWDSYRDDHCRHVDVCEQVLNSAEAYNILTDPLAFDFDFDPGVLPPLWQVAVDCRDPVIRHRALDLLKLHHRRCGHEDECSAAAIAEAVINIEEENFPNAKTCYDIPGYARVRVLEADLTRPKILRLKLSRSPFVEEQFVEVPFLALDVPPVIPFKLFPLAESMRLAGFQGLIRPKARSCRCKSYGG